MLPDPVRQRLKTRRPLLMGWSSLGSPFAIELMGHAGFDLVLIDQQHGVGGPAELLACLTAARAASLPALVRVSSNDFGQIGRVLDAGAQGIVCPMIDDERAAAAFFRAVKYPPMGARSWGAYRARLIAGSSYTPETANVWSIACAQIETAAAMERLDAILAAPGLDMICAGPNDLAIALTGNADVNAPKVLEALDLILDRCRTHGVIAAVFANDMNYVRPLIGKGWDIVAIGTDIGWLSLAAKAVVTNARS